MFHSAASIFCILTPLLFITTCVTPDINTSDRDFDYQTPAPLSWANPPIDSTQNYDFRTADLLIDEADFRLVAHPDRDVGRSAKELLNDLRAQQNKVLNFVNIKTKIPKTEVHLYHRAEDKGLLTKDTHQSTVEFSEQKIHLVINKLYPYGFSGKENQLYLRNLLGAPTSEILERGLGVYFCQNWQRLGYLNIAKKILRAEDFKSLGEFIKFYQSEGISPIVKTALAGYFVNFLIETNGKETLLANYQSWQPNDTTLQLLEKSWNLKIVEDENNRVEANAKSSMTSFPYLKGFNFAHEGYQIFNGYGSRLAQQSLQRVAALNANAVAIIPYTFMRDPTIATPIPIAQRAGQENDEASVRSHYDAQQLGIRTLLKPQIWLRRSWPGEIEMDTPENWELFFRYYTNWITHYALLAEIHQFDMLCIGVEMSETTLQKPDEWKKLIRKIRKIYSGPITYGSNWGKEFEEITFWEDLDYIGVSCYYPLTKKEKVSEKELKTAFSDILKILKKVQQKHQRPLLLTEIGFRNINHPWILPHARPDGRSENPADQEIAYRIVLESLQESDFVSGVFWWKYPANLNYVNPNAFAPLGLPAEATVERFFRNGR